MSRKKHVDPELYELLERLAGKDEALIARAAALVSEQQWRHLGMAEGLVWGACKSGGVQWFRTVARLDGTAHGCNCSVPQPCKHVLALLALAQAQPHLFGHDALPEWVPALLEGPADQAERAARNAAQRTRNRNQRLEAMIEGMRELERWMADLLRDGLATLPARSPQWWTEARARLVDAKLGALARRLEKRIEPLVGQGPDWPEQVAAELAWMHLLARAFAKWDELPVEWQEEVMQLAGAYKRKPELEKLPEVQDEWLVLHVEERDEGDLYARRAWLWGTTTRDIGFVLDFAPDDTPWQPPLEPGQVWWAAGVWYPGASKQRFRIFRYEARRPDQPVQPEGFAHWSAFAKHYAELLQSNPFVREVPALLEAVVPVRRDDHWWLVDAEGQAAAVGTDGREWWRLAAFSGGAPVRLFGEWNGLRLRPLTAWKGGEVAFITPWTPIARRARRPYGF